MRILVCDDEETQYKAARRLIPKSHQVSGLCAAPLKDALSGLFQSVLDLLGDTRSGSRPETSKAFEGYDLVIVDNDLTVLKLGGVPLSAEGLIGYLRAFTDIPYIVSLNKNQTVDFDLRSLFGDDRSLADLALNTSHLKCERLWQSTGERFAPWYWPILPSAAGRRRKQIEFVRARLKTPIWRELDFPDLASEYLSRHAKGALLICGSEQKMQDTTFRQFFEGTRSLLPRQKQALGDLADCGDPDALSAVSRIVAADFDRWVRRHVLGPQDVLIDVPHLIVRMPFLLGDRVGDLEHWNQAARETKEPFGMDLDIHNRHVCGERFPLDMWVPSPCFWWPPLRGNRDLTELFLTSGDWPDAVFCEDTSTFIEMPDDDDGTGPMEFEAEFEGSWPRRFVLHVDGKQYAPRSQLVG